MSMKLGVRITDVLKGLLKGMPVDVLDCSFHESPRECSGELSRRQHGNAYRVGSQVLKWVETAHLSANAFRSTFTHKSLLKGIIA